MNKWRGCVLERERAKERDRGRELVREQKRKIEGVS